MPAISQELLRRYAKPTLAQAEAGNYRMGHIRVHEAGEPKVSIGPKTEKVNRYRASDGELVRNRYSTQWDGSLHPRDAHGRFMQRESHDTPIGRVTVESTEPQKGRAPYEGMTPELVDSPWFDQRGRITVNGKPWVTEKESGITAEDASAAMEKSLARELKKILKNANLKGQAIEEGAAEIDLGASGKESVPWRVEHDGTGSAKAVVGNFYEESGMTKGQAKRLIAKAMSEYLEANWEHFPNDDTAANAKSHPGIFKPVAESLAAQLKAQLMNKPQRYSASSENELVTGKHGDRGRFVTTDDGNQIFITESGTVNQTGKPVAGDTPEPKRNRPESIPKATMQHSGGGVGIDLEGRLPQQQQAKPETDWGQRLKQLQERRGDRGIPDFAEPVEQPRKMWQEQLPQHPEAVNPAAESHPLHHSSLPPDMQQTVLRLSMAFNLALGEVAKKGSGARITGGDPAAAKRQEFNRLDRKPLEQAMGQLKDAINQAAKQGINLRPVIRHNDIIPRDLAVHLKPNDKLFRPVKPEERFAAMFDAAMEHYAVRRLKSQAGQMGLFDDHFAGKFIRKPNQLQSTFDWDESKVNRSEIGRFATKDGRKESTPERKALGKRAGDAKVLGATLYEALHNHRAVSLLGQTVKTKEDLASLADVYRDPRYETLRAFFVDKDGKIIGHNAYSMRHPAMVAFPPDALKQVESDFDSLGAAGFYMLHNHPSGDPEPSAPDRNFQRQLGDHFGDKCRGHVVINHNRYAEIDNNGNVQVKDLPKPNENLTAPDKAAVPHDYLGYEVNSTSAFARMASQVRPEKDRAVLVFCSVKGKVVMLMDISQKSMKEKSYKVTAAVRRAARAAGGDRRFLILPKGAEQDDAKRWLLDGIVMDVVESGESDTARELGAPAGPDPIETRAYQNPRAGRALMRERFSAIYESLVEKYTATLEQYGINARRKALKPGKGQQEFRWITVHPHGPDEKGQPVLIRNSDGTIAAGMGGKFNGQKIGEMGKAKATANAGQAAKPMHGATDLGSMPAEELAAHINSHKGTALTQSRQEDWGNAMRGQGRRVKGMVRGSMAAVPRGIKTYTDIVGALPPEERNELNGMEDFQKHAYAKAREAGLNHDQAFVWALEDSNEVPKGFTHARIKNPEIGVDDFTERTQDEVQSQTKRSPEPPEGKLRNAGDRISHPKHYWAHIGDVGRLLDGGGYYREPEGKPKPMTAKQMSRELDANVRFGDGLRNLLDKTGYFTDGRFFVDATSQKQEILGNKPFNPNARTPNFAQILEGHKQARPAKPIAYSSGSLTNEVVLEIEGGDHVHIDQKFYDTIRKMHGNSVQWHGTDSESTVYAKIGNRVVGGAMPMSGGNKFDPTMVGDKRTDASALPLERGSFEARIDPPKRERGKQVSTVVFQSPNSEKAAFAHAEKGGDGWTLFTGLPSGKAKTLHRIAGPFKTQSAMKEAVEKLSRHIADINDDGLPVFTEARGKTMSSDKYQSLRDAYIAKYMATLDQYAAKKVPKNSPGQLGLLNGGERLRSSKTQQKFRWITVKPNGPDAKGVPVMIDDEGTVQGGMGGKFTGQKIGDISTKKPSTEKESTPQTKGSSWEEMQAERRETDARHYRTRCR